MIIVVIVDLPFLPVRFCDLAHLRNALDDLATSVDALVHFLVEREALRLPAFWFDEREASI